MPLVDGGDLVVRALKQEAVDVIFTLCGGHVQSIYDACLDQNVRVIDVRHEQSAGHAAEGWSRATRKCGVAVVTAGPGVTDIITAIANAHQNRSPMLVIGGRTPLNRFEMGALQDLDHVELLRPITKWAACVYETKRIPEYVTTAFRHAMSSPCGPVYLDIPSNLLFGKVDEDEVTLPQAYRHQAEAYPDPALIEHAARLLSAAERPVIMAGSQVYWDAASDPLQAVAETLQAPVYLNAMGRGSLRQDHELFFSRSRRTALFNADVALILGTPMDFRLGYGKRFGPATRIIQIDIDPAQIGRNRDVAMGIVASTRASLELLAANLPSQRPAHNEWLGSLRIEEAKAAAQREEFMNSDAVPIHPLRLCRDIADFVDDNTIVVGDGGDIVGLASQVLPVNRPGQWYDPGPLGTLGVGPGFCMALQHLYPEKRILMVNGDGAFGLNGFEFDTFVRFQMPIVSIIGNDRQWGQISVGQRMMYGKDRVVASRLADNSRYDRVVEALGGHGEYVTEPAAIRPAIERAIASGRPSCVNVITDPQPPGVRGGYDFM